MSRARLVRCACGAERVREVEVWRVDEVTGAVVHVEAFAGEPESAHAAGECVQYIPTNRNGNPWLVTRAAADDLGRKAWPVAECACPAWARGYMGRA